MLKSIRAARSRHKSFFITFLLQKNFGIVLAEGHTPPFPLIILFRRENVKRIWGKWGEKEIAVYR
jgi:hypothetical protein